METRALLAARRSGLIEAEAPLLVMLSGGADSVCLVDVAIRLGADARGLHVNYGLRPAADADERFCAELCGRLGIPLAVERIELAAGSNLQARAREARYAAAERHASGDYAAAHTLSDQAETVLYRLVSSPGRRALVGMRPRRGRLVRPLLEATRRDTREHCLEAGLDWREDRSNADPRFARARIRHEVLPLLAQIAPAAERTIATTARLLAEEAELLEGLVDEALERVGAKAGSVSLEEVRRLPSPLARAVLRRLETDALPDAPVLSLADCEAILGLRADAGTASLDVGGGVRAVCEYGRLRFTRAREGERPAAVTLEVPGSVRFGAWEVEARGPGAPAEAQRRPGEEIACLSRARLGDVVTVRSWRAGDRLRPAHGAGSRKLQDLFTDRKLPRERRGEVPIVVAGDEIAWVPGIAVDERFRARDAADAVALSARLCG